MSATFLVALLAALLAIVYWRVVLVLVGALLIAMIVTGISSVAGIVTGQEQPPPAVIAPAGPDSAPGGAQADPDEGTESRESDPRAQDEPPR